MEGARHLKAVSPGATSVDVEQASKKKGGGSWCSTDIDVDIDIDTRLPVELVRPFLELVGELDVEAGLIGDLLGDLRRLGAHPGHL